MSSKTMSIRESVHAAHCCVLHGCKYGADNCPVTNGVVKQKYPCAWCIEEWPQSKGSYVPPINQIPPPPSSVYVREGEDGPDYNVKPPEIEFDVDLI